MASQSDSGKTVRPSWRARRRRLAMGLATVLGKKPQGFFIPYRYAADTPVRAERLGYPALGTRFKACEAAFRIHLDAIESYAKELAAIGDQPPPEPRWQQEWFPRLDAAAAYAMVREVRPRRIVEVGSGHSTRFYFRAVRDGGLETRITAIDPAPRADIAALDIDLHRATVQRAGLAPFADLAAGDVLSIDSSHILMPGSDVDMLFNDVLPRLPAGLHVHIHDIFLPDDYPPAWEWRGYNEQLGVGPLLLGGGFDIRWSSHYVATRMADALRGTVLEILERPADAIESGLWLLKRN